MTFSEKYYEGQISAGSSNPADDLRAAIATNIVNVDGWSVVDDGYTANSVKRSVLKLASATSGLATDMYLVLCNSTTAASTSLFAYVSEAYDTGTHLATYPAYPASSTDSSCRFTSGAPGATYYGATSTGTFYGYENRGFAWIIKTATSGYWAMNAYATHLVITTGTAGQPFYFGKFTSLVTTPGTNDPNPIVMFAGSGPDSNNCSLPANNGVNPGTRHMAVFTRWAMNGSYTKTAANTSDWYVTALAQYPYYVAPITALSLGYYTSTTDPYSGSTGVPAVPVLLLNFAQANSTGINSGTSRGLWRGKLLDVAYIGSGTWGDYLTIGGSTYQCAGQGYYFRKTA